MRLTLLLLLFCSLSLEMQGADERLKCEGNVAAVSKADIELIAAATKSWLHKRAGQKPGGQSTDRLSRIHIVNHDTAQAQLETIDAASGWPVTMVLKVRRVDRGWKADEIATVTRLGSFYPHQP